MDHHLGIGSIMGHLQDYFRRKPANFDITMVYLEN